LDVLPLLFGFCNRIFLCCPLPQPAGKLRARPFLRYRSFTGYLLFPSEKSVPFNFEVSLSSFSQGFRIIVRPSSPFKRDSCGHFICWYTIPPFFPFPIGLHDFAKFEFFFFSAGLLFFHRWHQLFLGQFPTSGTCLPHFLLGVGVLQLFPFPRVTDLFPPF